MMHQRFRELKPGFLKDNQYGELPFPPRELIVVGGGAFIAAAQATCRVCGEPFLFVLVPYAVDLVCGQCERRN